MPVNVNIPVWPMSRVVGPSGDFAACVIFKAQRRNKTPACDDVQDTCPPLFIPAKNVRHSHSCRPAFGNQRQKRFAEARSSQLQDHCLQRLAVERVRSGKWHDDKDFRAFAPHQGHSGAALA